MSELLNGRDVHVEIRIAANGLALQACAAYERLLKPFVQLPSQSMYMTTGLGPSTGENAAPDTKTFTAHVYGRRVLDATLETAVFELLQNVPQAYVEVTRGLPARQGGVNRLKDADAVRTYRKMLACYLREEPSFRLVLVGKAHKATEPELKVVNGGR